MKSLITTLALLVVAQNAMAGELIIGQGFASGPRGTDAKSLYSQAKLEVATHFPANAFKQISRWSTWIAAVGSESYVGAEASFVDINDSGPYLISTTENRVWARNKAEIPEFVELSKERALSKAKFFCNSEVTQVLPWDVKLTPKDGFQEAEDIEVTSRFLCKQ